MCFFVYSPSKHITIEFATETIFLKRNGASVVKTVFLVKNNIDEYIKRQAQTPQKTEPQPSPDKNGKEKKKLSKKAAFANHSIDKIKIIYPNILPKKDGFINLTSSLEEFISPDKNDLGMPVDFSYPKGHWPNTMNLTFPNPTDAKKDIMYSGMVYNKDKLGTGIPLTDPRLTVLEKNKYTILTYKFQHPLTTKGAWIYVKFQGQCAAQNFKPSLQSFVNRYTNSLLYSYDVFGPIDTKKRFIRKMQAYHKETTKYEGFEPLADATQNILEEMERDGIIDNNNHALCSTVYKHYHLNINPGKMGEITNITPRGNIKQEQSFSDESSAWDGTYNWIGQASKTKPLTFLIKFNAKPSYALYKITPLLALTLVIDTKLGSPFSRYFEYLWGIVIKLFS